MEEKLHAARLLVGRLRGAAAAHDAAATADTVAEIRLVTKNDPEIRAPLADAGAVPFLAAQLTSTAPSAATVDAAAALLNISISAREQLMSAPGLLDALTAALRADSGAAHHAAATVHSLLCVESHRTAVGARRRLLAALIALLRAAPTTRAVKDALKALFGIALHPPNRAALVELGVVRPLFALVVADGRAGVVEDVTAVIAQVAGCAESLHAFRWISGVRILLDLLEPGGAGTTPRARDNAAAALLNLVVAGGEQAVAEVVAVGGAEEIVRELAEDVTASPRGKAKAEALLRALEEGGGAAAKRREHRLADFLNGLVQSDPYISSPASASTHG